MTKEVRQGLGLLAVALICLLLGLAAGGADAARILNPAALLFGIGGLVLVAVGLFRTS